MHKILINFNYILASLIFFIVKLSIEKLVFFYIFFFLTSFPRTKHNIVIFSLLFFLSYTWFLEKIRGKIRRKENRGDK